MDAQEQSTAIHALAMCLSKNLTAEEASRLGLLLIQLGSTLETVLALQELDENSNSKKACSEPLDASVLNKP